MGQCSSQFCSVEDNEINNKSDIMYSINNCITEKNSNPNAFKMAVFIKKIRGMKSTVELVNVIFYILRL